MKFNNFNGIFSTPLNRLALSPHGLGGAILPGVEGEVKSPGGYLRGLVERAQVGELHLDRSFYGRLSGAGG